MAITTPKEFFRAYQTGASWLWRWEFPPGLFLVEAHNSPWKWPVCLGNFWKKKASLYPKTITHFEGLSIIIYIQLVSCCGEAGTDSRRCLVTGCVKNCGQSSQKKEQPDSQTWILSQDVSSSPFSSWTKDESKPLKPHHRNSEKDYDTENWDR